MTHCIKKHSRNTYPIAHMNNYTHDFVPIKSSASAIKTILPFPEHFECPVCT